MPKSLRVLLYAVRGRAEKAAEKGRIDGEIEVRTPQGLKPDVDSIGFGGTTKVVPCYKAFL